MSKLDHLWKMSTIADGLEDFTDFRQEAIRFLQYITGDPVVAHGMVPEQ
jgi:hypothetical protein